MPQRTNRPNEPYTCPFCEGYQTTSALGQSMSVHRKRLLQHLQRCKTKKRKEEATDEDGNNRMES